MTIPHLIFPWDKTPIGGGFFVPALNTFEVRKAGLIAAMHYRFKVKAAIGVKAGRYGVLFTRTA